MSLRTDVKQSIEKLTDSTAFHVVAGAGDLAAEKLREAQSKLADLDMQAGLARVPTRVAEVRGKAQERLAEMPERLAALRTDRKATQAAMQERARQVPERAQDLAAQLAGLALQTYGDLATRGRTVVERRRATMPPATPPPLPEPTSESHPEPPAGSEVQPSRPAKKAPARKPRTPSATVRKPAAGRTTKKA